MSIILTQRDQALSFMSPIVDIIFKYKGFLRCCIPGVFTLEEMKHAVYCHNPSSSFTFVDYLNPQDSKHVINSR